MAPLSADDKKEVERLARRIAEEELGHLARNVIRPIEKRLDNLEAAVRQSLGRR
jgi:hypothetical protein